MFMATPVFPSVPVATTGQSLLSQAGLNVVTSFVDALGFRDLCEDRLGQFVPAAFVSLRCMRMTPESDGT